MDNLSISQAYLLCALNSKGKLPVFGAEHQVCLVAGSILDLVLTGCVKVEDKNLSVSAPFSGNGWLKGVYDDIGQKDSISLEKITALYSFQLSGRKVKDLINGIGQSLADQGLADSPEKKSVYIPRADAVDRVIQSIRAELLEEGEVSDETVALASLMEKSNMIKKYFSSYEKDTLKKRLKELKSTEFHRLVAEMVDYIVTMIAIISASGGVG